MTDQPEQKSPFPHAGGSLDTTKAAEQNPDVEDEQDRTDAESIRADRAEEQALQAEEAHADEPGLAETVRSSSVQS